VLTRLSHGHIRIGTFQRLAFFGETENISKLTRYCVENLYGEQPSGDDAKDALRLFEMVCAATAELAASYLAAGFVHGVLNSDNINISGESFDYGPWRFTPEWDSSFTAAYFDQTGLYAFGRQPEAIQWDVAQLAGCLALLMPDAKPLSDALAGWGLSFERALASALVGRLGVAPGGEEDDRQLAIAILAALESREASIDRLFYDWRGGRDPGKAAYPSEPFRALARGVEGRIQLPAHAYWSDGQPCSMHLEEVEAIWAAIAERDDWQPLDDKVRAIRRMGEAISELGD
jgi:uncharacterized protein YdiU (UPF0061 family)